MKKTLFTALICLSFVATSFGQSLTTTSLSLHLSEVDPPAGRRLRNTGIGLLCFGVVDIIGGIAMVSSAHGVVHYNSTTYNGVTTTEGSLTGAMGALGIIGGTFATVGGSLMTYVGQRKMNKSKSKVSLTITPMSGSVVFHF